ncbi:hypothetical protein CAEBREN_10719 [Caenorhabditis brenneri]|uniref:C-type lectin domain-containing protein n=1 Tax=Caenorhabditis brenneri TaxID=135651 RepID=G0P646_CAEBE|nr:hypothetical protein CAEBREN_10719 [Caenorhabditis brenneri]
MTKVLIYLCCLLATVSTMIIVKPPQVQCDDNGGEVENKGCGTNWTHFQRPSGGWCMQVFYENYLNQTEAEARCQQQQATLSGFQNPQEVEFATAAGRSHLNPSSGSLWFGAKRTQECMKSGLTESCTALNSYAWTDNSATGTSGFIWSEGQPANYAREQGCAILTIGPNERVANFDVGAFDDVGCEIRYNGTNRAIKGYVCGKKPKN